MPYDERLADRIRSQIDNLPVLERRMFGGLAFLLRGKMSVGVLHDELIARVVVNWIEELERLVP